MEFECKKCGCIFEITNGRNEHFCSQECLDIYYEYLKAYN